MTFLNVDDVTLKSFSIDIKPIMEKYLRKIEIDISDYTFAANYIWLSDATGFYAIIEDTFCLFVLSGGELSMMLPPLGEKEQVFKAVEKCFALMNSNNSSLYYSKIEYVHESILEGFVDYLEEGTVIFELLENYIVEKKLLDYVYETDSLIQLAGNSYKTKRNEVNGFKKAHPNYTIEKLDIDKHAKDMIDLFNKWVSDRIKYIPKEEVDDFMHGIYLERLAVKRLIREYDKLDVVGIVLFIGGEIKGFTVGEKINSSTSCIIIEKTDFEILGCAQFIFREFCSVLKEEYGTEFINVGDDMGFENLKKVKMSYRPTKMIPKYIIYQR